MLPHFRHKSTICLTSFIRSKPNTANSYIWSLVPQLRATHSSSSQTSSSNAALFPWSILALTSVLASYEAYDQYNNAKISDNCGIVGIVSKNSQAPDFLLEGLTILQNRGYDSAGMATQPHPEPENPFPEIKITKYASVKGTADSIHLLREGRHRHDKDPVGIAHTRWATHGGKTDRNSHPHTDNDRQVALVHNGTITNYYDLRLELEEDGVEFHTDTDTEVIAQLVGRLISEGADLLTATRIALQKLEGTWGLCIMARNEPGKIVVARNGSPLVIGYGVNEMYIASEITAFSRHTKRFISLKDDEIAVIHSDTAELNPEHMEDGSNLQRFPTSRLHIAPDIKVRLSPEPFPHWTIREIMEQPKAVAAALGYGGRVSDDKVYLGGLETQREKMLHIRHLLISACGTSLNAGKYGMKLMQSVGAFETICCIDAAEGRSNSLPRNENGGLLVISQSGETKDVHRFLKVAENSNVPVFSVVNAVGSLIARTTKCGVYVNAGRENAVASTKAFVTQVTVLGLIACWFGQNRENNESNRSKMDELIQSMHRLPITMGMALRSRPQCVEVAEKLKDAEHLFVLGKGYGEPIAYEGALKIKEITYLHAEGYSGGALKHGPFALIESENGKFGRTPIIMIVLDDENGSAMCTAAEEVKARGAYTIIITDNPTMVQNIGDYVIPIPNNGPMTALLASIPLQLIAYELALKRGINPDVPRNLAKAVTVD